MSTTVARRQSRLLTDRVRGNEIVMYQRSKDRDLTLIGSFPTGRLENSQPQLGSGPAPTSTVFGAPRSPRPEA